MPSSSNRSVVQRYAIALGAVALGMAFKLALQVVTPQEDAPFLLMTLVVMLAGWYGGVGPGLLATGLTTVCVRVLFMDPRWSLNITDSGQATNLIVYAVEGAFIALLCESRLWALRESNEAREKLEERVASRTLELSEANVSIERQREFLSALLASLQEGIVAMDASGKVILVNRAAREMYGLPLEGEEVVPYEQWGKYHQSFHSNGVTPVEQSERPLTRVMKEHSLIDVEKVVVTNDGRRRFLLSTGKRISGPDGSVLGAVVAFRDMSLRKAAEEELTRSAAQLQRSNRELQNFASVASHDLQEPLRKIQAFGDRLRTRYAEALGDEGRDYLGRMLNASQRMSTLINDLLTFSRVTTKAQPFMAVDLGQIAKEVISDLETRIEQTGGRVEVEGLPTVEADEIQMRQLLQNLIGNALKFHKPEQPPVVRVSGKMVEGDCEMTVQDNGIGFEEKYLDRIFNVFQRLHGRTEYEGTGIGLAVCRKIVERHHGSITARSKPGEGAAFVITLPCKQAGNSPAGETDVQTW